MRRDTPSPGAAASFAQPFAQFLHGEVKEAFVLADKTGDVMDDIQRAYENARNPPLAQNEQVDPLNIQAAGEIEEAGQTEAGG